MRQEKGSIGNIMATGICLLAVTVVMLSYMDDVLLIRQKTEINQIARQYILRMETVGYLTAEDRIELEGELQGIGVTSLSLTGTTVSPTGYGEIIILEIQGMLEEKYGFAEKRVSTAKH